jgi:hypothetical protein
MRRIKMRYIICIVLFLSNFNLFSQGEFSVDLDLGTAIPMNKDLKEVFDLGLSASLGTSINILNENLYLKPSGGIKWYYKEIEKVNSVNEHLRNWKAGLEVHYYVFKNDKIMLAPFIRLDHNWTNNYYSETYSYDPFTNTSTTATSDNYFEGNGFSTAIGSFIKVNDFFFKIDYEIFAPNLKVNQSIIAEAYSQGVIIEPNQPFNFSSLTLSIGYSYILKL